MKRIQRLAGIFTMVSAFLIGGPLLGRASEEQVPEEKNKLAAKISVHGFGSLGFLNSSHNNYLMESRGGSFDFNELALNGMFDLRDDLRVGAQVFIGDMGDYGNYEPRLDWGYVDWRPKNWLGIRGGKFKRPNGLYNETLDVDAARTFILLPQSVYSYQFRDFLLATTGVGGYGNLNLESGGDIDYQIYYGLPNTDQEIDKRDLQKVFLGRSSELGGKRVVLATLQDGTPHKEFTDSYLQMTPQQFTNHWRKIVFSGTGKEPHSFKSEAELVAFVSRTPGAIGYIGSGASPSGVKTLKVN